MTRHSLSPIFFLCPALASALTLSDISQNLESIGDTYTTRLTYGVWLPSAEHEIIYNVDIYAKSAPGDTLSPCNYVIEWDMPEKNSNGFSAYFDGHHYRFNNDKLQEYHYDTNPNVFAPVSGNQTRNAHNGVQQQARFANLTPWALADALRAMQNDTNYTYTIQPNTTIQGIPATVVKGTQRSSGYDIKDFKYCFDNTTLRPILIEEITSPGLISEQTITIRYDTGDPSKTIDLSTLNENTLIALFPEEFARFRTSNYRVENMVGRPLPAMSIPTLTGERYSRNRGDSFKAPTIIAFIDPDINSASDTVRKVRDAVDQSPIDVDVVWAFLSRDIDAIEATTNHINHYNEYMLRGANSLARDCGVTNPPTILFCSPDGMIADLTIGFNNMLDQIVTQKILESNK